MHLLLSCSGCQMPAARVDATRYRLLPAATYCPRCSGAALISAILAEA